MKPMASSVASTLVRPTISGSNITSHGAFSARIIQNQGHFWRENVVKCLEELVKLESGWDGYNATPVSFENAYFALRMLETICPSDTPNPQIVPGTSGDLQIEWHTESTDIELHVRGPYDVHVWRATKETGEDGEEFQLTNDFASVSHWIAEISESVIDSQRSAA